MDASMPCRTPQAMLHGTVRAIKINDLGGMRIRFRFVLVQKLTPTKSCGRFGLWLWMDSAPRCADSANHITSSRQAPILTQGIIGRATATARNEGACRRAACVHSYQN